jgi:hypothetical protein
MESTITKPQSRGELKMANRQRELMYLPAYADVPILSREDAALLSDGILLYYESPFTTPKTQSDAVFMITSGGEFYGAGYVHDAHTIIRPSTKPICAPSGLARFRIVTMKHAEQFAAIPVLTALHYGMQVVDIYDKYRGLEDLNFRYVGEKK